MPYKLFRPLVKPAAAALLVTLAACSSGPPTQGEKVAAAAAGAVLGAALLAAASDDHKHRHHRGHPSYSTDSEFRTSWGKSYSPHRGITCFPGQRACYKDGRGYSVKWSRREF